MRFVNRPTRVNTLTASSGDEVVKGFTGSAGRTPIGRPRVDTSGRPQRGRHATDAARVRGTPAPALATMRA